MKIVFWFCLLFIINSLQSQNNTLNKKELKTIDSLYNITFDKKEFIKAAKLAHDYSIKAYKKKDYFLAIEYAIKEIKAFEDGKIINSDYINAVYNLARFSYLNKDNESAIKFYIKSSSLGDKKLRAKSYCSLARVYDDLGDYYKSISYYEKGIKEYEINNMYSKSFLHYSNLARVYDKIKTKRGIERKLVLLQRLDSLSNYYSFSDGRRYILNNHFANSYGNPLKYDFKKALYYYKKNLAIGKKYNDSTVFEATYSNIADLYLREKNDSVKYFIDKGLSYVKRNKVKAILYDNLAQYLLYKKELRKSLLQINKAISINTSIDLKMPMTKALTKLEILNSQSIHHLLFCFKKKTEILISLYEKNKSFKLLEEVIMIAKSTDHLISLILNNNSENKTKSLWREEASEVYTSAVLASQLLGKNSDAFYFMERNRSLLLIEAINKNIRNEILPYNVLRIDNKLHKKIYALENLISREKSKESTVKLEDSLFLVKKNYDRFIDSVKRIYPKSFKNNLRIEQVSLEKTQKNLNKNSVIVSYLYHSINKVDDRLLVMVISKNNIKTFTIKKIKEVSSYIKKYSQLVSNPLYTKEEQSKFREVSFNLFQILFPNEEIREVIKNKNLTIIPDGNLHNIPFDALIVDENKSNYLIENAVINYAYSMSFLINNTQVKRTSNKEIIAFAPIEYTKDSSLVKLNNVQHEVNAIQKLTDISLFLKEKATKENFLNESSNYKIIHLATHANSSDNPWIAFFDEKIKLHELYEYKNNANLVVLSACNTSLGQILPGEGVLSLARGFFYSGAKSVVSSLWSVNDKSASYIMTNFYKNLKKGQKKAEALANAKRTYLNNHTLSQLSPYYWSSFVLIGDANEITFSKNYLFYWSIGIILLLFFFYISRKTLLKRHL